MCLGNSRVHTLCCTEQEPELRAHMLSGPAPRQAHGPGIKVQVSAPLLTKLRGWERVRGIVPMSKWEKGAQRPQPLGQITKPSTGQTPVTQHSGPPCVDSCITALGPSSFVKSDPQYLSLLFPTRIRGSCSVGHLQVP